MPDPNDLASQQIADTEGSYDPYKRSQPPVRVLGMTGQQDYPGAIGLPVGGGGAGNALAQRQRITAYHGSPHDFDEFDASKIGTGEGAQSYGHGLYFAENPKVSQSYTKAGYGRGSGDAVVYLPDGRRLTGDTLSDQMLNDVAHGNIKGARLAYEQPRGNLYEVSIDAHPDEFLDWDKPLSEQSGHVQTAVGKVVDRDISQETGWQKLTGQEVLGAAVERGGSRGGGEAALHAAGIKGIRYLDQGSRDAGQGTHNYVIFDPKIVQILKKNGIDVVRGNAAMEGE